MKKSSTLLPSSSLSVFVSDIISPEYVLATNPSGVISKIFKDSLQITTKPDSGLLILPIEYGENISLGELVSIGDGKTGYINNIIAGSYSSIFEQTSKIKRISQKFFTSLKAKSIKAVVTDLTISGGVFLIYKIYITTDNGGVPSNTILGSAEFVYNNTSNSGGFGTTVGMVFNPPVLVAANTQYHIVGYCYDSLGSSLSRLETSSSNIYSNGNLLITTNSGITWTSYPTRDCLFKIYEIHTNSGVAYKSQLFDPATVLGSDVFTSYNFNPYSNFTDKGNAFLGIAKESGMIGETKRVVISGVANIPGANLAVGTYYSVGWTAGQLGTGATRVGMGIGPTKLLVTH